MTKPTKPPGPRVSGTGQVHMTIRLPAPIRNKLASQARRENRTMSAIVADALTKLWEK